MLSHTLINKNLPNLCTDGWVVRKAPTNRTHNRISFNFTTVVSRSCPVEPQKLERRDVEGLRCRRGDHTTFHFVISFASLRLHESIFSYRLQLTIPSRWPHDLERRKATFLFCVIITPSFFLIFNRTICKCCYRHTIGKLHLLGKHRMRKRHSKSSGLRK